MAAIGGASYKKVRRRESRIHAMWMPNAAPTSKQAEALVSRPSTNDADMALPHDFQVLYSELEKATQQFSRSMRIGGGGSCEVFRGVLKGVDVAVKILKQGQGETPSGAGQSDSILSSEGKQFFAEMRLLQAVQHPNICQLLGVSLDGPHRW